MEYPLAQAWWGTPAPDAEDDPLVLLVDRAADPPYQISAQPDSGQLRVLDDQLMLGYCPQWPQLRQGLVRQALRGRSTDAYLEQLSPLERHALLPLAEWLAPMLDPRHGQAAAPTGAAREQLAPFRFAGTNPAVDCVVQRGSQLLLICRGPNGPHAGEWALPGGFHDTDADPGQPWQPGKETAAQAALRELVEETGLSVEELEEHLEYVGFFDDHGRDPRNHGLGWVVSNVFRVQLPAGSHSGVQAGDDAAEAEWIELEELESLPLAFDHRAILRQAGLLR